MLIKNEPIEGFKPRRSLRLKNNLNYQFKYRSENFQDEIDSNEKDKEYNSKIDQQKQKLNRKYKYNAEFREAVKQKCRSYYWHKLKDDPKYFQKRYNKKRRDYMRKRLEDPKYRQIHYERVREYQKRKRQENDKDFNEYKIKIENLEADSFNTSQNNQSSKTQKHKSKSFRNLNDLNDESNIKIELIDLAT